MVIAEGAIVEIGYHNELVAAGGRCAEMYETRTFHAQEVAA